MIQPTTILPWIRSNNNSSASSEKFNYQNCMKKLRHNAKMNNSDTMIENIASNSHDARAEERSWESDEARRVSLLSPEKQVTESDSSGGFAPVSAPNYLGPSDFRRLLLEDVMTIPDGTDIMLIVAPQHSHFASYETVFKQLPKHCQHLWNWQSTNAPCLQLPAKVIGNPKRQSLVDGTMPRSDLDFALNANGNDSIQVEYLFINPVIRIELQWKELHDNPTTIAVWAQLPHQRNFYSTLRQKNSEEALEKLLSRLLLEVSGDRFMTRDLLSAYKIACNGINSKVEQDSNLPQESTAKETLAQEASVLEHIEKVCRERILGTFGTFVSLVTPILSHEDILGMIDCLQRSAPDTYNSIGESLGYSQKANFSKSKHMLFRFEYNTLLQFIVRSRVKNDHVAPSFGNIIAASAFRKSHSEQSRKVPIALGIETHPDTLSRHLKDVATPEYTLDKIRQNLYEGKHLRVSIAVFDNAQKGKRLKFQRGGKSSNYLVATAAMMVEPVLRLSDTLGNFDAPQARVPMTYIDQKIPSPQHMPRFEVASGWTSSRTFRNIQQIPAGETPSADYTGARIDSYIKHLLVAEEMITIQRNLSSKTIEFAFQPKKFQSSLRADAIRKLHSLRCQDGLFGHARAFQQSTVDAWRGDMPRMKVALLPVMDIDETTKDGSGEVVLNLLEVAGLIKKDSDGTITLADDIHERVQYLVGDGLTLARIREFEKDLERPGANKLSFSSSYEQRTALSRALRQVVMIPGDLHMGGFHFLDPIFTLYYGSFLQPIQVALGWKHIYGHDVSQCFQQATQLVDIVLSGCERILYDRVFHSIPQDEHEHQMATKSEEQYCEWLASKFVAFLVATADQSENEVDAMVANFVITARLFRLFQKSSRCGDEVTKEHLSVEFLPIFHELKKRNYSEIDLSLMEEYYARVPFPILEILRRNRTQKLYLGTDGNGKPMAFHELDDCMEMVMPKIKEMPVKTTGESWTAHSTKIPLVAKSSVFVDTWFTEYTDVETYDSWVNGTIFDKGLDQRTKRHKTAKPRRTREKELVMEILTAMELHKDGLSCTMHKDLVWNLLETLKTTFADLNEDESESAEMTESEAEGTNIDEAVVAPPHQNDPDNKNDVKNELVETDATKKSKKVEYYRGTVCGRSVKVGKVDMHPLAAKNIIARGKQNLLALDLPRSRLRRKQRREREKRVLYDALYNSLTQAEIGIGVATKELSSSARAFRQLQVE